MLIAAFAVTFNSLPRQEITQRHELAMRLILNVHHTPTIFPCAHGFATDIHFPFRTNHREWDHVLHVCDN